jgi:hypothetical protein
MLKRKSNFATTSSSEANTQIVQQHNQYQSTSQDGQYKEDEYTDYDDGEEYFKRPWNSSKHNEMFPKHTYSTTPQHQPTNQPQNPYRHQNSTTQQNTIPNYPPHQTNTHQAFREKTQHHPIHTYYYNPNINPQYNYQQLPNYNYNQYLQFQIEL